MTAILACLYISGDSQAVTAAASVAKGGNSDLYKSGGQDGSNITATLRQ